MNGGIKVAYAVIETGGKQFKVQSGDVIDIEKIETSKGDKVVFDKVLLYSKDEKTVIGAPYIENMTVEGEVVSQFKGKKIIVFKYKPKKRYRRKSGHRQNYTKIKIGDIAA